MNKDIIIERQANENLKLVNDNKDLQETLRKRNETIVILQQRINKAIDILDNSSHYLKICIDNDLTPMQLASKILKGEIEVVENNE